MAEVNNMGVILKQNVERYPNGNLKRETRITSERIGLVGYEMTYHENGGPKKEIKILNNAWRCDAENVQEWYEYSKNGEGGTRHFYDARGQIYCDNPQPDLPPIHVWTKWWILGRLVFRNDKLGEHPEDVCHITTILWSIGGNEDDDCYMRGLAHCEDGPARREWDENGTLTRVGWIFKGHCHREDGPTTVIRRPDGTKRVKFWHVGGEFHRVDGPAVKRWSKKEEPKHCSWYFIGHYHNKNGPAVQCWDKYGNLTEEKHHIRGEAPLVKVKSANKK